MRRIENVRRPVAEGTAAIGKPAPPVLRMQAGTEIMPRSSDVPEIPIESGRDRMSAIETRHIPTMPATGRVHVRIDARDVFDDPGFGPRLELEKVRTGVTLVSHLGDHTGAGGLGHEQLDLLKGVGQRFLEVDMLAGRHTGHRYREVGKIGRGNRDRVEFVSFPRQHLAEVAVERNVAESGAGFGAVFALEVDVGSGDKLDEISGAKEFDILRAAIADAHEGETNFVAGCAGDCRGGGDLPSVGLAAGPEQGRGEGALFQEVTAGRINGL